MRKISASFNRVKQAKPKVLDEVVVWLEKHQPLTKALELLLLAGPVLFPHSKVWNLP
jgi:hypothetical protein